MGRPKDKRYWNQVWKLENGVLQCKRCGHEFKGGVSRIKAHVDRKQGQGIAACPIAPGSVPDNEGVDNIIAAGSSNPQEVVNAMNSSEVAGGHEMIIGSSSHQNNTEHNLFEVAGGHEMIIGSSSHQYNTEHNLLEGRAPEEASIGNFESEIKKLVDNLTCVEDYMKGQLQWLESRGKKRKRQVDDWLKGIGDLRKRATDMNNSVDQFEQEDLISLHQLTEEVRKHKEQKPLLLSNELVGKGFETNIRKIWELLKDDQVFIVGIHGMGGVGKTCLVTHIKNEITRNDTFKHVFWVNVSQKFSILKLQDDIAKRIGVKLDEEDERIRAEILSSALEEKEKSVLILDDVWSYIDLQKVGIPLRVNGLKLILTSRLEHVCQQMDCSIIRIKLLPFHEAWELFLLKLGSYGTPATLPHKVLHIAKSVARECKGLPLGISVVARTMKGIDDIRGWKHALNKLRNRPMGEEMEEEVFKVLKLSYDNLMDKNIQNCFLHSALYHNISEVELIMNLVEEGLINEKRSLEEIFFEGRIILDKFKGHSLLLGKDSDLWVHGLVRDMACHILKDSHRHMVKCNEGLTKIPRMVEWTDDLEKVSLMQNYIEKIPADTSPCYPRLSTLIFSGNRFSSIPDCFFSHMNALAILDLSDNPDLTCLPNSVSNLRSLKSLLLRRCRSLEYVPPLGQLNALSRLVISCTSIKKVPQGLEMLINLKWLDLSGNNNLKLIPGSVLPRLTKMQYLNLHCHLGSTKLKVEDVQGMRKLECFAGSFQDVVNFNDYVRNTLEKGCGPKTYFLLSGTDPRKKWKYVDEYYHPTIEDMKTINIGDVVEFADFLPPDHTELFIAENKQRITCLCDALSSNGSSSLSYIDIRIRDCPELKSLFCLSGSCTFCTHIRGLESLLLDNLTSVAAIWKENDEGITNIFPRSGIFCHLKKLQIEKCHKMEKLLTPGSLRHLRNLEEIVVKRCDSVTEIFAVSNSNDDNDSSITLPHLKRLEIEYCPKIEKLLTPGSLRHLRNLEEIVVESCNSMTEIFAVSNSNDDDDSSITLPHLERLQIEDCPKMEKLLTPGSLRHLRNLEEIVVWSCESMTEIFAVSNSNDDDDSSITLPHLKRLEIQECHNMELLTPGSLRHLRNLEEIVVRGCSSMTEIFAVSNSNDDDDSSITLPHLKRLQIEYCDNMEELLTSGSLRHLRNLEEIVVRGCESMTEIFAVSNSNDDDDSSITLPHLKRLEIEYCPKMEKLLTPGSLRHLRNLEEIVVRGCSSITEIFAVSNSNDDDDSSITLPHLKRLQIEKCHKMEKLLTPGSLRHLRNLEEIVVRSCYSMTEIFAVSNSNDDDDSSITLPHLKRLEIEYCPKMEKLLTPGSLRHLRNLEEIVVESCNSMTEIFAVSNSNDDDDSSITLPHLERLQIEDCPKMEKLLTPGSLRHLRNLEEIVVESCNSMTEIFAVSNSNDDDDSSITLPHLERLQIEDCPKMEKLLTPGSLRHLRNLEEIVVWSCESMTEIFAVSNSNDDDDSSITLPHLKRLEIQECHNMELLTPGSLRHLRNLEEIVVRGCSSMTEIFAVSNSNDDDDSSITLPHLKRLQIEYCDNMEELLTSGSLRHLRNLEEIVVRGCESMTEIFAVSNSNDDDDSSITLPHLKRLEIEYCPKMEKLLTPGSLRHLRNLEEIVVRGCYSMTEIFAVSNSNDDDDSSITLLHLKRLEIEDCHNMEKCLTPGSLRHLRNLEEIVVRGCSSMTEIFAVSNSNDDDDSSITLPKLRRLEIINLLELKIVCRGIIVCGSSDVLSVSVCPNLQRLPTVQVFSESDS